MTIKLFRNSWLSTAALLLLTLAAPALSQQVASATSATVYANPT